MFTAAKVSPARDEDNAARKRAPEAAGSVVVGASNDAAELEADRMAQQALGVAQDWASRAQPAAVSRSATSSSGSFTLPAARLANDDAGQPLPSSARTRFERAYGTDLSSVRLHTDARSASAAQSIDALAYTRGNDIHFAAGAYQPGTPQGDHVLAHEVAHVAQSEQAAGNGAAGLHRFSRGVLSAPAKWKAEMPQVKRPSGGLSGGIYFLEAKDPQPGDVKRIVVKPIFGSNSGGTMETAETLVFSDRLLSELFGIKTPVSRAVQGGSPEFSELMELLLPHAAQQPAPGQAGHAEWKPLSEATQLVVMSEVPEAVPLDKLGEKAATDTKARGDLLRTLFDFDFLRQLGSVHVADMLIGNEDRFNERKTNLGNVMVSLAGNKSTLYAIDTHAVLDKVDPKKVVQDGVASSSLDGTASAKTQFFPSAKDKSAAEHFLDMFMHQMVWKVKDATPKDQPTGNAPNLADLIEHTYKSNKQAYLGAFEFGWQNTLTDVLALVTSKQGRHKMRELTKEFEGTEGAPLLQKEALKTNALYLSGVAQGKSHQEAREDPTQYAATAWLASMQLSELLPPADEFHWNVPEPSADALSADLEDLPELPRWADLQGVGARVGWKRAKFDSVAGALRTAQAAAEGYGTKSRRGKQLVRNRTQAARYLTQAAGLAIGGYRAAGLADEQLDFLDAVKSAVGGRVSPRKSSLILPKAQFIRDQIPVTQSHLRNFARSLERASSAVKKMRRYSKREDLATTLTKSASRVQEEIERFDQQSKVKNPNLLINLLRGGGVRG